MVNAIRFTDLDTVHGSNSENIPYIDSCTQSKDSSTSHEYQIDF